jgi:hypothetical protein
VNPPISGVPVLQLGMVTQGVRRVTFMTHAGAMPGSTTSISSETNSTSSVGFTLDQSGKLAVDRVITNDLSNLLHDAFVPHLLDVFGMRNVEADFPVILVVVPADDGVADTNVLYSLERYARHAVRLRTYDLRYWSCWVPKGPLERRTRNSYRALRVCPMKIA